MNVTRIGSETSSPWFKPSFRFLGFTAIVLTLLNFLATMISCIGLRYDLTSPEGAIAWSVWRVAQGESLYSDWTLWPHRFMPYGPLLCYPIGKLGQLLEVPYGFWTYSVGRIQSLISFIGIVFTSGAILQLFVKRPLWQCACYYLLWCSLWPTLFIATVSFRSDMPSQFFTLLALYCIIRFPHRNGFAAGIFFIVIANAYKPSALSLPFAVTTWLLLEGKKDACLSWICAMVSVGILYVGTMEWLTYGNFLHNQIQASAMGITTDIYHSIISSLLWPDIQFPIITMDTYLRIAAAVGCILATLLQWKTVASQLRLIFIYTLTAVTFGHLTLMKSGSSFNYLLETYIACGFVIPCVLNAATGLNINFKLAWKTVAATLLFVPLLYHAFISANILRNNLQVTEQAPEVMNLRTFPDTAILTEVSYLHPSANAHLLDDMMPYIRHVERGNLSAEPLVHRLQAQSYSHIVLGPGSQYLIETATGHGRLIHTVLKENYKITTGTQTFQAWTPWPRKKHLRKTLRQ